MCEGYFRDGGAVSDVPCLSPAGGGPGGHSGGGSYAAPIWYLLLGGDFGFFGNPLCAGSGRVSLDGYDHSFWGSIADLRLGHLSLVHVSSLVGKMC